MNNNHEININNLSPETVRRLLTSHILNTPTNTSRNAKIAIASGVVYDIISNLVKGQRPLTFSLILGLIYAIVAILGLKLVYDAIIWALETIGECIFRGVKALCGI